MEINIKARAKINITLDVLGKRPDNYHEVRMIMQTVDLADNVNIKIGRGKNIRLKTNLYFLPTDNRNIAYKAAELFFNETGIVNNGVDINILKKIPVAAGLAGGSTNAAAVLIGLNKLYKANISLEDMMKMSKVLGADVPYCVRGGTMLSEGIGEILTPLPNMPECEVVLCKPPFSVSTAKIYSKIDSAKIINRPDTTGVIDALNNADYTSISRRMFNVMEEVTASMHKEIPYIKNVLFDSGADGAVMSGSGPTTFGLFSDWKKCELAYARLRALFNDTHMTKISNDINDV